MVDSRLQWAVAAVDGNASCWYPPRAAHAQHLAGRTILSAG
jgi:hypothetical protein